MAKRPKNITIPEAYKLGSLMVVELETVIAKHIHASNMPDYAVAKFGITAVCNMIFAMNQDVQKTRDLTHREVCEFLEALNDFAPKVKKWAKESGLDE